MNRHFIAQLFIIGLAPIMGAASAQQVASASFSTTKTGAAGSASTSFPAPRAAESFPCAASAVCGQNAPKPASKSAKQPKKAKPFDPLEVHPTVAVRETKAKEIVLPGVMKIDGASAHALDFTRAREIEMTNGGAQVVYVSQVDQNRIQLPWANPKVNGTEEVDVDKSAASNNVYVQFKEGVTRPVTMYFEERGTNVVLALQLVPKKISGQTVIVKDNRRLSGGSATAPKSNDYVSLHQSLAEMVALGSAPTSYSETELRLQPIVMNGVVIHPKVQYSSSDRDIFVYEVVNPGPAKVTLREQEFDGDRVLAVSIFPKPILAANERAKVIVIAGKQKEM